jgi:hypothetical protein
MRVTTIVAFLFLVQVFIAAARADEGTPAEKPAASNGGPRLGEATVEKWKIGISVSASGGPVGRLTGTTTIPIDWPEQSVKIVRQDLSPGVTLGFKWYGTPEQSDVKKKSYGTAKQMVANIARVADGQEVHAFLVVEVTRHTLLPPEETESLTAPDAKSLPPDLKPYLNPSPMIESNHPRIKAIAKQLAAGQTRAWPHVRAIYDWVRKTIQYKEKAELTSCVKAIENGEGDCNHLTSTFIAICRASGIPARTVRIPGHCYPEFYLLDAQGQGHWYPAEASGTEDFGGIRTHTPVLQKGDNFKVLVPGAAAKAYRFLPENLVGMNARSGGRPALKPVCEPAE